MHGREAGVSRQTSMSHTLVIYKNKFGFRLLFVCPSIHYSLDLEFRNRESPVYNITINDPNILKKDLRWSISWCDPYGLFEICAAWKMGMGTTKFSKLGTSFGHGSFQIIGNMKTWINRRKQENMDTKIHNISFYKFRK